MDLLDLCCIIKVKHQTANQFHPLRSIVLQVQAEVKKRWQVFLFTHHLQVRSCFQGAPLKHLWKHTRGQHPQRCRQSDTYDEASASATHPHLFQVAVCAGGEGLQVAKAKAPAPSGRNATGLDFLTRKSLSSSDGEITLGETMEEILEESEF